ncbi:MAG: outer membrane lipid asymmetry maintenance protein MlaD [Endozoicomonadaceae bacterium]|nr:outer membrane lipid asymmetry maintenance protein MlaD [Endozoicomonadaceae bacterium]MCY4330059.1 outer membrane lipid asymmetry maintenance protein MlaD [Endozoicomonadaceae bacterium]
MRIRAIETGVGIFMLAGIFSLILLGFKVSNLSLTPNHQTYTLYAEFDNIGSLNDRARIAIGGVTIGRVSNIILNKKTYMAKVTLNIDNKIDNIPVDSTAAIMTAGLLGEKYIAISIGGENRYLKPGDTFSDTQSALILENLIGKFLLKSGASGAQSNTVISGNHEQF